MARKPRAAACRPLCHSATGDVVKAELADASSVGVPDGEGGDFRIGGKRLKTYFFIMERPALRGLTTG